MNELHVCVINRISITFFSVGKPCPMNYNPADHYVHTLAIIPGNEEECKAKAMVCFWKEY